MLTPPQYPAGVFQPVSHLGIEQRDALIVETEAFPRIVSTLVSNWSEVQLETRYKNWTARQILHHLPDSHLNAYLRFKWALTEPHPTIKPYDESAWSALADAQSGSVVPPLLLLQAVHLRWVQLLRTLNDSQWLRTFHHPESGEDVSLLNSLQAYVWHGRHHLGQLQWLHEQHGW